MNVEESNVACSLKKNHLQRRQFSFFGSEWLNSSLSVQGHKYGMYLT